MKPKKKCCQNPTHSATNIGYPHIANKKNKKKPFCIPHIACNMGGNGAIWGVLFPSGEK
jgi:hypothetical protein